MPTTLRSYAKINLGLAIGPIRDDGFHSLLTLYQTIALHDLVTVTARRLPSAATHSRLSLTSNNPRVPCDARNTAWRMISGALECMGFSAEVNIHIEKRLPIQGGLGAGSANAAAALIALESELGEVLSQEKRFNLASHVGSDVPLFLLGGTVLGTGRGELVEQFPDFPVTACVVAIPDVSVSTPRAFQAWDSLQHLTSGFKEGSFEKLSRAYGLLKPKDVNSELGLDWLVSGISNDFEQVVFDQHPSIIQIKQTLSGKSAYCALSGSGSALFGLYTSTSDAISACARLQQIKVKALVTQTLPKSSYWAKMVEKVPDRQ